MKINQLLETPIDMTGDPPDPNFNGGMGAIQIYGRALSDAEITQNYNTTKSYYGL